MKVSEYLQLSREERTKHVDLSTPCNVDESVRWSSRRERAKKALFERFGLEDDVPDWRRGRVNLCHLCACHSKNGWCSNIAHIYVGTPSENTSDVPSELFEENGSRAGRRLRDENKGLFDPKTIEQAKKYCSDAGKKGGPRATSLLDVSLFDGFVDAPCRVAHHNKAVGADPNSRVRLERELLSLLDRLEEFTYTLTPRRGGPYQNRGRRVPLELLEELRKTHG